MTKRNTIIIGAATYAILLFLAVFFYKERMVMMDTSLQLFESLRLMKFPNLDRFGASLTHLFPIIAAGMGMSIQAVTISYSVSYIILYAIYFFLIAVVFKNPKLAMCLVFYNVVMVTHSFFWVQCEVVQGVAFSFFFLAAVESQINRDKLSLGFILLSPVALITIVWFYPLLPFVIVFALLYIWFHHGKKKPVFIFLMLAVYVLIACLKMQFWNSWYDRAATDSYKHIFTNLPNYLSIKSVKDFTKYCIDDYYLVPILLCINTAVLLFQKKYMKALLSVGFFCFLVFIITICHPDGTTQFYLEPQYTILAVYVSIPFFYDVVPAMHNRKLVIAGVIIIIAISIVRIWNTHYVYTKRLNWYRTFLSETRSLSDEKLIVKAGTAPMDLLKFDWGTSMEFWLLSTLETGYSRMIIVEEKPGEFDKYLYDNTVFIRKWDALPLKSFQNSTYFNFENPSAYYQKYPQ